MTVSTYDEFSMLKENADEAGIVWSGQPSIVRRAVEVRPGQMLSALAWGQDPAEMVFLHGGGQNAHTWDTVALALGRPLVAVDLPGHGHSSWREDKEYWPVTNAEAVVTLLDELRVSARTVVGMSLGGLTAIRLAGAYPGRFDHVVVVDVSPGVGAHTGMTLEQRGSTALISGPRSYASFDEILEATHRLVPHRPLSNVRRGVLHNAREFPDGRWGWRYDELSPEVAEGEEPPRPDFTPLWDDVAKITVPIMLVRGAKSVHVSDEDVEEFRRRAPQARFEVVQDAGHSVQTDQPLVLANLIADFVG